MNYTFSYVTKTAAVLKNAAFSLTSPAPYHHIPRFPLFPPVTSRPTLAFLCHTSDVRLHKCRGNALTRPYVTFCLYLVRNSLTHDDNYMFVRRLIQSENNTATAHEPHATGPGGVKLPSHIWGRVCHKTLTVLVTYNTLKFFNRTNLSRVLIYRTA